MPTYAMVRRRDFGAAPLLDIDTFAQRSGLHPDMVTRFVKLGLLDASTDPSGQVLLPLDQLAAVARLQRLRAGLALNYAALGLVVDLLDRIAVLEAAVRRIPRPPTGETRWT
jgi:hypothetical protein